MALLSKKVTTKQIDEGYLSLTQSIKSRQPVYKLYGNGTLELKVNEDTENKMVINNVSDFVVVDSERFVCYKGNEIKRCKGQFPFFNIGMNRIETNATKIEITLNKRWL